MGTELQVKKQELLMFLKQPDRKINPEVPLLFVYKFPLQSTWSLGNSV